MKTWVVIALAVLVVVIITGYWLFVSSLSGPVSREEILRIKSPDSRVEAVAVRINVGATTPYRYKLFIVPAGRQPEAEGENLSADHLEDLSVSWQANKLLSVSYREARIYHFSNFWYSGEVDNWAYVVEVKLVPLSASFSLSAKDRYADR